MIDNTSHLDFKPWIKRYPAAAGDDTRATLVFPHAGGAALAYRSLGTALATAGSDAYVMQYPQRGDRVTHPAPATVGDLASELFDAGDWAGIGPLRLFGHCMGAVVAFEFARVAERHGVEVDALWVSASEAPATVAAAPALPTAESEIIAEMVDLGGTDPQLLADDDFVELLLMAVRADYDAFNRYACDADVTIGADIHTLGGDRDHRVSEDMLRRWETHTTGAFTVSMFDGGHFYVNDHTADVAELINGFSQLIGADPVVIVGMALEAPGGIDTADGYWSLLSEQREGLGHFPTDRGWAIRDLFDGSRRDGFKAIHDLGGFLSDAASFDPAFFGISPREAVAMDPQQRVGLRLAWRALENSGINPDDVAGHDVGCYVGASGLEYGPELSEFSSHSGHLITGTSLGVISGRIAYTLDLAGPALTVDTSCSSALTALHTAVHAVRSDDCDMALAGGVCVMGTPGYFVEFSKQHALSDDGHCRPYSALASGTVWAEGAAMFLLQRKSRAVADGRRILAEIRATAVNQDGRTVGLTAPSGTQQARLFTKAIQSAGLRPEDVGMIEGHGTGTRLGDRTELRSLAQTYGATAPGAGALLGSVKSNVGHAQAAAGALGLAKVIVAAAHGAVPASLHVDEMSREIDWDAQGLRLATKQTPWPAVNGQRVAAVSAFGMSGTNAHVIVSMPEEPGDDTEGRAA